MKRVHMGSIRALKSLSIAKLNSPVVEMSVLCAANPHIRTLSASFQCPAKSVQKIGMKSELDCICICRRPHEGQTMLQMDPSKQRHLADAFTVKLISALAGTA